MVARSTLSTVNPNLSTDSWDNFKALTSTFTSYPQEIALPITTIFIYKYLSPQANLWGSGNKIHHSVYPALYAKLSNLEGVYSQTNEMRASA
jgi:hypothetical protein